MQVCELSLCSTMQMKYAVQTLCITSSFSWSSAFGSASASRISTFVSSVASRSQTSFILPTFSPTTINTIPSSITISLSQDDINGWYDTDSNVDRNSFLYIILGGAFFFTLLLNVLPDIIRQGGENASVMEREKKGKSRPSDRYKSLGDRLTDWDDSSLSSLASCGKNTGDYYCNNKGDHGSFNDDGLSIAIDGYDSVGYVGDSSGDDGDSGGDDGGDCGDYITPTIQYRRSIIIC